MGKIALAILCGSLAIALAIAQSNRYSMTVAGRAWNRLDHITGEIVSCGVSEKGVVCVRFPTDHMRPALEPQK
jgi:hypothetical protein